MGVGHGFLSGEGFRCYQNSVVSGLLFQHFRDVGAIDVRHKVHVQVVLYGRSASVTMYGPRSEPPIPMFTTSVIALPV